MSNARVELSPHPFAVTNSTPKESNRRDTLVLLGITALFMLGHILTNGRYGFHRDELQFLSDARHLDWGFVAYPPMTPFLERISLAIFGLSLTGLRLFSVFAQGGVIVIAGLIARDLGGGRLAQITTAIAVGLSPVPMFEATEFQYTSFDFLWWVLAAWFVVRLLKSEDPRWWLAIGVALGLGLQTKYSIVFYIAGILGGMLLSRARRYFVSAWFWIGVVIALLIFLPNLIWLIRHDFISYQFLQHIHTRDVGEGRAEGYWTGQFWICVNLAAAPLWIAGSIAYLRNNRYRMLGWMYLIPLAMFGFSKGRFYYVAAVYPMLLAMGSVAGERWVLGFKAWARRSIVAVNFAAIGVVGAYVCAIIVPLASNGPLRDFALKNQGDLREEIGWDELVRTVAAIRDSLPAGQQANVGILVGNYGEAGAIENLSSAYHLPPPISLTNSFYLRSYPTTQPSTLIVVGWSHADLDRTFTSCHLAGHNGNSLGVSNEESQYHPDIFVCGPPLQPWPEFWAHHQRFG